LRNASGVDQSGVVASDSGGIAIHSSRVESQVEVREVYERLLGSVRRVVVGKDRVVDLCLISLLAGGHVLLTDIPGVGKTTLAKAISASIAADFSRIQFTPDLLPSDITGTSIYDPGEARFGWIPGPVFAPILLADEINRATPRTQSALLEAMAEGQVTVEGETRTAERENRLQDLIRKLITAQEEERRKVSYEVHDGLAQTAAGAHQLLQAFARQHPPTSEKGSLDLARVLQLVQQTVGEARYVIADLRPTALDDFGLAAAVRLQVEKISSEGSQVDYEEALGDERLPPEVETALFRVAQEALTNVHKHAPSARVRITLRRLNDTVRLQVRDWGPGFNPEKITDGGGPGERLGLSSMRERMALLGGHLEVHSRPGEGTEVVAEIPSVQINRKGR
jgi:signal transduction histidine kinase